MSIAGLGSIVVLLIVSTRLKRINVEYVCTTMELFSKSDYHFPRSFFFGGLIVGTTLMSASASYLQNAVVALSASFGPIYLQGILSGQGAIALIVAAIQLLSAYAALSQTPVEPQPSGALFAVQDGFSPFSASPITIREINGPRPEQGILNSAFSFFVAIGCFTVVSLLSYVLLVQLPLYKLVIRANEDGSDSDSFQQPQASLRVVERKVRKLGLSVFGTFAVTLAVFPSITSTILSVNEGRLAPGTFGANLTQAAVFLPVGFLVFAAGDWIGRVLPQIKVLAFTNWKALMILSAARIVFIVSHRIELPYRDANATLISLCS